MVLWWNGFGWKGVVLVGKVLQGWDLENGSYVFEMKK